MESRSNITSDSMRSFIGPLCRRYIFASYRHSISPEPFWKSGAQLCRQWLENGDINLIFEKNRELSEERRKLEISL